MRATFGAAGSVRSTSVSRTVERPGIGAIAALAVPGCGAGATSIAIGAETVESTSARVPRMSSWWA